MGRWFSSRVGSGVVAVAAVAGLGACESDEFSEREQGEVCSIDSRNAERVFLEEAEAAGVREHVVAEASVYARNGLKHCLQEKWSKTVLDCRAKAETEAQLTACLDQR